MKVVKTILLYDLMQLSSLLVQSTAFLALHLAIWTVIITSNMELNLNQKYRAEIVVVCTCLKGL